MVYEVGLDGEIVHLKDIGPPKDPYDIPKEKNSKPKEKKADGDKVEDDKTSKAGETSKEEENDVASEVAPPVETELPPLPEELQFPPHPQWPIKTTHALLAILSSAQIVALHNLFVEGREPPRQADSGWGNRKSRGIGAIAGGDGEEEMMNASADGLVVEQESGWERAFANRGGGGGRGGWGDRGRGGRGRGRGRGGFGNANGFGGAEKPVDTREVLSDVSERKLKARCTHCNILITDAYHA